MRTPSSIRYAVVVLLRHALAMTTLCAQSPFVTMEGRKFMLNGQEFYPKVLNYRVELASSTGTGILPSDLYFTPSFTYDRNVQQGTECNSSSTCNTQLLQHFQKVASMGFNCLRLVGPGPFLQNDVMIGRDMALTVLQNDGTVPTPTHRLQLTSPGYNDQFSIRWFELLVGLLDIAEYAGLKVILLSADENDAVDVGEDVDAVESYAEYLRRLSEELQDHPALLAYDLWNEPAYPWTSAMLNWTKSDICGFTEQWYDAINANDANHLVTLGGCSYHDMDVWDFSTMRLDFYSPHVYPDPWDFDGYDFPATLARYKAELYWLARSCPMPYLIGETAFSAEDETDDHWVDPFGTNNHLDADPAHHQMPWMHGSEAEQATFATESMNATRAYLGSGYSWWDFQNSRWNNLQSSSESYRGNFFGPLHYGDGVLPWTDKEVVAVFQNYVLATPPTELGPEPSNYHDLLGFDGNPVLGNWIIKDQQGVPIRDAAIRCKYSYHALDDPDLLVRACEDRVISNSQGEVVIHDGPVVAGAVLHRIELWTRIHGAVTTYYNSGADWPISGSIVTVDRASLEFDAAFDAVEVAIGEEERFWAWNSVVVSDGLVQGNGTTGGTSDLMARQSIHLTNEFHAGAGSEVHLHLGQTFPDCGSTAYRQALVPSGRGSAPNVDRQEPEPIAIRLQFETGTGTSLSVYPNPCRDKLSVLGLTKQCDYRLYDASGILVDSGVLDASSNVIPVSRFAAGEYSLAVNTSPALRTLKCTIVP